MTANRNPVKVILTDIEGTTSSLSFVKDTLFPYARNHLADYIYDYADKIENLIAEVKKEERNPDLNLEEVIEVLLRYIDEDQKVTALKTLQGMIWEEGYKTGELTGHIYDDAMHGLKRWNDQGVDLYVYSSGSIAAQKLLFGNTEHGDLRLLFKGYFDTTIGHKKEPESYEKIAAEIGVPSENILFLSDSTEEIAAAHKAGMQVIILDREKSLFDAGEHYVAHDFDNILDMADA